MLFPKTIRILSVWLLSFFLIPQSNAQELLPAPLEVTFVLAFGEKGEQPGQFMLPGGIAADANGSIYVADTGNNRLQKFDSTGKLLAITGGFGWNSEQFQQPMDICSGNLLDFYIADRENSRIERYNKELHYISSLYSNRALEEKLQFTFPVSLSMSIHGELFILDSENTRILKLNSQFAPALSFGGFDWGRGALDNPAQIHVSRNDLVYVSDQGKQCLVAYDYFGNTIDEFGRGILSAPTGICTGLHDLLVVADSGLDQLVFFNKSGAWLQQFGVNGNGYCEFNNPGDVAMQNEFLYVADSGNNRVQVFKITVR